MNAPMSRVLPTPVASAKQSEGKSRSKSVTVGNSRRMTSRAACDVGVLSRRRRSRVTRSRISSDSRCGGRRLRRPAMALTWRFIARPPRRAVRKYGLPSARLVRLRSGSSARFLGGCGQVLDLQAVVVLAPFAAGEDGLGDLLDGQVRDSRPARRGRRCRRPAASAPARPRR